MSDQNDKTQKDIINFAFSELTNAFNEAKSGRPPTSSYEKIKKLYDELYKVEKQKENEEISEEEMQIKMREQIEKLKEKF